MVMRLLALESHKINWFSKPSDRSIELEWRLESYILNSTQWCVLCLLSSRTTDLVGRQRILITLYWFCVSEIRVCLVFPWYLMTGYYFAKLETWNWRLALSLNLFRVKVNSAFLYHYNILNSYSGYSPRCRTRKFTLSIFHRRCLFWRSCLLIVYSFKENFLPHILWTLMSHLLRPCVYLEINKIIIYKAYALG